MKNYLINSILVIAFMTLLGLAQKAMVFDMYGYYQHTTISLAILATAGIIGLFTLVNLIKNNLTK